MRSSGLGGPSGRYVFSGGYLRAWIMVITPTWVAVNLIALVVERRTEMLLHPGGQYKALCFGDSIFLPAVAVAIWYLGQYLPRPNLSEKSWWHVLCIAASVAVAIGFHWWDTTTHFYTRSQTNSPTKLYHDFVLLPWFVYTLVSAGIPAIAKSRGGWKARLVIIVMLAAYSSLNYYDSLHRPTHGQVNFDWDSFRPGK